MMLQVEQDKDEINQFIDLAQEECQKGNKSEAVKILFEVVQRWPNCQFAHNDLGCILFNMGKRQQGFDCMRKALQLNPNDQRSLQNLAAMICDSKRGEFDIDKVSPNRAHVYDQSYGFEGWGMQTSHAHPWAEDLDSTFLLQAHAEAIANFDSPRIPSLPGISMEEKWYNLLWRHWTITYAVRHAVQFTQEPDIKLVECGVCDGMSAFFTLKELKGQYYLEHINSFCLHLYDSWGSMREQGLLEEEKGIAGQFRENDIERTKKNLSDFDDNTVYHQGFIPESLNSSPTAPESISYLHIDLNSVEPTIAALEFFFPRLLRGGIVLFDDFGWKEYRPTREAVIKFFVDKPGIFMPSPTGQAIYYR